MNKGKILNLGAGKEPIKDAVNHDITKHSEFIDIVWNLNKLPWPWPDNSFDKIVAWAVLEHLEISLMQSMNECWRILRPNGIVKVKLPYWNSEGCWDDPTHKRGYTLRSMDYFDPDTKFGRQYGFYTPYKWKGLSKGVVKGSNISIYFELRVRK